MSGSFQKYFLSDSFADEVQASGVQDASDGRETVEECKLQSQPQEVCRPRSTQQRGQSQ